MIYKIILISNSKITLDSGYLPKANTAQFTDIINILLAIIGAIAVFIAVYAGVQLVMSRGDTEKIATARRSLLAAIAGLVIIFSASLIVSFVWDKV